MSSITQHRRTVEVFRVPSNASKDFPLHTAVPKPKPFPHTNSTGGSQRIRQHRRTPLVFGPPINHSNDRPSAGASTSAPRQRPFVRTTACSSPSTGTDGFDLDFLDLNDDEDGEDGSGSDTEGEPTPRVRPVAITGDVVDILDLYDSGSDSASSSSSSSSSSSDDFFNDEDRPSSESIRETCVESCEEIVRNSPEHRKIEGVAEYEDDEDWLNEEEDIYNVSDDDDVDPSYNDENEPLKDALLKHEQQIGGEFCSQEEAFGLNFNYFFTNTSVQDVIDLCEEPGDSYLACMRICRKCIDEGETDGDPMEIKEEALEVLADSIMAWLSEEDPRETLTLGRAKFALLGQFIRTTVVARGAATAIIGLLDEYAHVDGFMSGMQALYWYAGPCMGEEDYEEETKEAVERLKTVVDQRPEDPETPLMYKKIQHAVKLYLWRAKITAPKTERLNSRDIDAQVELERTFPDYCSLRRGLRDFGWINFTD